MITKTYEQNIISSLIKNYFEPEITLICLPPFYHDQHYRPMIPPTEGG